MTDLRERAPAHAVMEKFVSMRGTPDVRELPFGMVRLSRDAISWWRGVNGELLMAKRLAKLGPGWTVLHSVPVGERGSDIDHLVIGPAGVFPINTKRLIDRRVWVAGGRFLVDGRKTDFLRNSEFEARRVEKVLRAAGNPAPVVPVVAITGAKSITVKATPAWNDRPIGVAAIGEVVRRIKRRPAKLTEPQVEHTVGVLSDPRAWSKTAIGSLDPELVRSQYELIDRGAMRFRRVMLTVGYSIMGVGIVGALVWLPNLFTSMFG